MTRLDLRFPSADQYCSAWLYLPDGAPPAPVIVMAHGLGGTRVMRLDAFAERFCAAGYACLVFDYRHFGDSAASRVSCWMSIASCRIWAAAMACARARPEVDGTRVVLWGTSFGGGHVLAAAADDGKVAAVTGAASGIGFASAKAMADAGARVVLIDRDEAALAKACAAIGERASPLVLDLLDAKQCVSLLQRTLSIAGPLDIFHANAGLYVGGDLVDADPLTDCP